MGSNRNEPANRAMTTAAATQYDPGESRLREAIDSLRYKDVRSTTLERLRLMREADERVCQHPQSLQLGEGLYYLLDRISLPLSPHDLLLGRIAEEVPDAAGEAFFQESLAAWNNSTRPPWMRDGGHTCFAWDRLLELGLPGLETLARQQLGDRTAGGAPRETLDFLSGAVRIYEALRLYSRRYAEAAYEAGLVEPAGRCAAVAERPPETFAEGLQLMWLVGHIYCTMVAHNPTLTFGRMDELLLPLYRHDVAAGRLTQEQAGDLIEDFYCKNNLILGRGEHQMSGGSEKATGWSRNLTYDAPQYIVLGGRRPDRSDVANELTELFLERVVPRFENPVVVLRYTSDLPQAIWQLACDHMRANASIMVYNDHDVIPAMEHCGIAAADAVTYTMHGCNWPDIPGIQRTKVTAYQILPKILREVLMTTNGRIRSMEDVYTCLKEELHSRVAADIERTRQEDARWEDRQPGKLQVRDCFLDGPIATARSAILGGVKYPTIVCAIAGLASAADALAVLAECVFGSSKLSLDQLRHALKADFTGFENLRQLCLNTPKFGQDDDRADRHGVRLLNIAQSSIDAACIQDGKDRVFAFRCLETDMRHIRFGRDLGATADGRHAGEPISENTSPTPGSCRQGLTAMLNSLAKLPFHRINSGALNLRLQPEIFAGDAGLKHLAQVLRTYLDLGGLQVQLSVVGVDELRDAQIHPERHRDLMVRITGYSAAFVDMGRAAQDEIIRREQMGA
jgi:pyruvate-formate lyase